MSSVQGDIAGQAMMLTVKVHDFGDTKVLECAGRITFGCTNILRIAVSQRPLAQIVVLDLGAVSGIDAAGLGTLVSLRTWARETGRTLNLMNLTPRLEELLQLTHLRSVFEVFSAQQMFDLFCRAIDRSQSGIEPAVLRIGQGLMEHSRCLAKAVVEAHSESLRLLSTLHRRLWNRPV